MPVGHFRHYLEHYLAPHPSHEVKELFVATAILDFAVALVMIFEPVYLYSLGWSLTKILLFYAAVYILYFLFLPIGGRICRKHGFEHTILWSSPFLILYYLSFFAIGYNAVFIAVAIVALVIQKILYWPSYHSNFAAWSDRTEVGREVSNLSALVSLATAVAPLVGGVIIMSGGYKALFVLSASLILFSNVPLLRTPEVFEPKSFGYFSAIKRIAEPRNRRCLLAAFGFGEELVTMVVWPVFLIVALPDPLEVGALISFSMIATILIALYVGRIVDEGGRIAVLRNGAMFVSGSWAVRLFLGSGAVGLFLIDAFYRVAKNMVGLPMTAIIYSDGGRDGTTEEVVFFEMALSLGKITCALAAALIFWLMPNWWSGAFVLAAGFALLYAAMNERS
ncbi:MAG: MFS transporter [Patescibacteria group bacterium]|nr:MFS transporter [Patescibacteria group bacterium]